MVVRALTGSNASSSHAATLVAVLALLALLLAALLALLAILLLLLAAMLGALALVLLVAGRLLAALVRIRLVLVGHHRFLFCPQSRKTNVRGGGMFLPRP